jgi:hypothetical protein
MNANGLYNGLEGYIVPGTNSGMGMGVANGVVNNEVNTKIKILDKYNGAAAAYSLRKLSNNYNGPAIRVRRSNDNAEQDIRFNGNGNLDESNLIAFVGANSGFVSIWYDQSGNSNRDSTQTTQAEQPRIVNAGVIDRLNGNPCFIFDGINDNLISDNLASTMTGEDKPFSVISVCSKDNINTTAALLGFGRSTTVVPTLIPIGFVNQNNDYRFQIRDDATVNTVFDGGFYAANTQYLLSNYSTGFSFELFSNSLSQINNSYNTGVTTLNQFCIGAARRSSTPDFPLAGKIQEIIFYDSNKSPNRTQIENNINQYYKIY